MTTILNLAQIAKKMKKKPVKMQIYSFFNDSSLNMTPSQIDNMVEIIDKENGIVKAFLAEQKKRTIEKNTKSIDA